MANKEDYIGMRINPITKEGWDKFVKTSNKFDNLSQLIRYCVSSYIDGTLIEIGNNSISPEDQEKLKLLQNSEKQELETLASKLAEMEMHMKSIAVSKEAMNSEKMRGQILTLLEKTKCTSGDIAKILNLEEFKVAEQLSLLLKSEVIRFNKNMEYEVIQ